MIEYRNLEEKCINRELFNGFIRHQVVTKCWRRDCGEWVIRDAPFVDDWSEADYRELICSLKSTAAAGGFVYGAFLDGALKGFVSVEPEIFCPEQRYLDMAFLHVSEDMRGQGVGKTLFLAARDWARKQGAAKLYISAHSAVESQGFYRAMGCTEAQVYNEKHVEKEPYDCQLECSVI